MVNKRDITLEDAEDLIMEVVRQMLVVTQLIMDTGGSIIICPEKAGPDSRREAKYEVFFNPAF